METSSILGFFTIILIITAYVYKRISYWQSNIPCPGIFWFLNLKNTPDKLKNFCEKNQAGLVQGWLVLKVENYFKILFNLKSTVMVVHPDTARIILKDEETFLREAESFGDIGDLVKEAMGFANGEKYKLMRDIMGPSFHYDYIKNFVPIFQQKASDLFSFWKEKDGKNIDIHPDTSHFTIDSLGLAAFGMDFNSIRGGHHKYIDAYNYLMRFELPKSKSKLTEVKNDLSKMTSEMIKKKENAGTQAEKDFLDRLLAEKGKLTEDQIRDNVFMMFVAGHETTAGALAFGLHFMTLYPHFQEKAREEVESVLKGDLPDAENVKGLTFLEMFIKETLRIRSGTFPSRVAAKDTYVDKYFIPKGTKVGLSMYTIHHLEEFWPEPYKFDPYRFTPENSAGRHPYCYLPFSLGRRMCLGNNFSLLQQKIFLSMILQRFKVVKNEKCLENLYSVWFGVAPTGIILDFVPLNVK